MTDFVGTGRTSVVDPFELRPVEDQRERILRALPTPRRAEIPTAEALGLVLVNDVVAVTPLPAFTNSAMDGYAVIAADLAPATAGRPVHLTPIGEVLAGHAANRPAGDPTTSRGSSEIDAGGEGSSVVPGATMAVMTGALLPPGAEAVVPVELTSPGPDGTIAFRAPVEARTNVRAAGEEIAPGQALLPARHRVTAADIGVLLSTGVDTVEVVARPRVAVITTGDELVPAGQEVGPGQIRDSNGPMLAAMLTELDCEVVRAGPVEDRLPALTAALEAHVDDVDLIVLSGGVSAGVRDHVADAIETLGEVERTKLAMQPGMPQALGRISRTAVIGLPGNPVSAFVSFEVLVRPAIRVLQGRADGQRAQVTAVLDEAVKSPPGKRSYLRMRVRRVDGEWRASMAGGQGSHMIGALSKADALGEVPEDVTSMAAGERILLHLLVS